MNGMDGFLLGRAMAENNQSLQSMFAGQQEAAADRRADQTTASLIRQLREEAEELFTAKCRLTAEKKATMAFLKGFIKNDANGNQAAWANFFAAYESVRVQAPERFDAASAKTFADKLYADLQ